MQSLGPRFIFYNIAKKNLPFSKDMLYKSSEMAEDSWYIFRIYDGIYGKNPRLEQGQTLRT
jgi:hypothetical protein